MNLKKYIKTPAMQEGEQVLTVYRTGEAVADTGTRMIQLALRNDNGASLLQNFPLTSKGLAYLAGFCAACGLTDYEMENFDPASLKGRKVTGNVIKNSAGYFMMNAWSPYQEKGEAHDQSDGDGHTVTIADLF